MKRIATVLIALSMALGAMAQEFTINELKLIFAGNAEYIKGKGLKPYDSPDGAFVGAWVREATYEDEKWTMTPNGLFLDIDFETIVRDRMLLLMFRDMDYFKRLLSQASENGFEYLTSTQEDEGFTHFYDMSTNDGSPDLMLIAMEYKPEGLYAILLVMDDDNDGEDDDELGYSEEPEEEEIEEEAIPFRLVETKPSFNGGDANEFSKWVAERLVYPEIAKENGVQGRVMVQFTVEVNGQVSNVKVIRGVEPSLDREAVRVVSMSPKWTPGTQNDRPVRVTYTFPVIFQFRKPDPDSDAAGQN